MQLAEFIDHLATKASVDGMITDDLGRRHGGRVRVLRGGKQDGSP